MQSTSNYLWLLSDILGQGATANVFRGRQKVCEEFSYASSFMKSTTKVQDLGLKQMCLCNYSCLVFNF